MFNKKLFSLVFTLILVSCGNSSSTILQGIGTNQTLHVNITTNPQTPQNGQPFEVTFKLSDATKNDQPFTNLALDHTKYMHLIVVSTDLSYFDHVHPESVREGDWRQKLNLPSNDYLLYNEFFPGGTRDLVTTTVHITGQATSKVALVPDSTLSKNFGPLHCTLSLQPSTISANTNTFFTFHLTTTGGDAVTDLSPYLGASSHMIIISSDTARFVHTHPSDMTMGGMSMGNNQAMNLPTPPPGTHYGPDIKYTYAFPAPGRYKIWAQVNYHNQEIALDYVLDVV